MKKKKAGKKRKAVQRAAKPGKFAGRSLFKVIGKKDVNLADPATFDTPAKAADVKRRMKLLSVSQGLTGALDAMERYARGVLDRAGYQDAAGVARAGALPLNDSAGRAAQILAAVDQVRKCISEPAAEKAAFAMLCLMDLMRDAAVDRYAESVLRDRARQAATVCGGQNKRQTAASAWKEAAATALRATAPRYLAKVAWAWLASEGRVEVTGGAVQMESDGLHFDGRDSGAKITYQGFRVYVTKARAEIDAADILRS